LAVGSVLSAQSVAAHDVADRSAHTMPSASEQLTSARGTASLPPAFHPEIFQGVSGSFQPAPHGLPDPSATFAGVSGDVLIRPSVEGFSAVQGLAQLPPPAMTVFKAATGRLLLPQPPVSPAAFAGVSGETGLAPAIGIEAFDGAMGSAEVRMAFPGGGDVFVGYAIGVPLGAEKSILQSRLHRETEQPSR